MRSLCALLLFAAGCLASTGAAQPAEEWPVAVISKATATSTGTGEDGPALPRYAFDGYDMPGVYTRWCAAGENATGQSVTVHFTAPVEFDHAQLAVDEPVRGLELITDHGTVAAVKNDRGVFTATLSGATRQVTVRITETDEATKRPVCISDVTFSRRNMTVTLLHGVPAAAVTRLRPSFTSAGAALKRCKADALARIADFPVRYDYIGPGDRTAQGRLADAAALAKLCRTRDGLKDLTTEPKSHARAGTVALNAGDGHRLIFVWRGGAWRLQQIEGTGRRRH